MDDKESLVELEAERPQPAAAGLLLVQIAVDCEWLASGLVKMSRWRHLSARGPDRSA